MQQNRIRALLGSWPVQAMAWFFFLVGLAWAGFVGLILYKGGTWAHLVYASRPIRDSLVSITAFMIWHALRQAGSYTARDWGRMAARIILLALSLGVSLLAAEIGIRTYLARTQTRNSIESLRRLRAQGKPIPVYTTHPLAIIVQPSDNLRLIYDLLPSLDIDFGHTRVRTNKAGMRQDIDYPQAHPAQCVRIMGIGDSGMFGWNVEQGEEYLGVLRSNLTAHTNGVRYEVFNLGVPGYNTQLEVESLRSKGLAYRPDVVIVGWCENDYDLPMFVLQSQNFRRRDISFLYCLLFDRVRFSELSPVQMRNLREFDRAKVIDSVVSGTAREGVRRALRELKELGKQYDFRILVFGPMGEVVCGLCREVGLPYFNTREKVPADKYPADYAVHFMHPRPGGHRVLAEHMERELEARGWLRPRTAAAAPAAR